MITFDNFLPSDEVSTFIPLFPLIFSSCSPSTLLISCSNLSPPSLLFLSCSYPLLLQLLFSQTLDNNWTTTGQQTNNK